MASPQAATSNQRRRRRQLPYEPAQLPYEPAQLLLSKCTGTVRVHRCRDANQLQRCASVVGAQVFRKCAGADSSIRKGMFWLGSGAKATSSRVVVVVVVVAAELQRCCLSAQVA